MAILNKNIAIEESSTITARVATVEIARGSTNEQQEILVLGDPQTSNALAVVIDSTPPSTSFGLVVREAVPQSTGPFAISSIAGQTRIAPASTAWASSAGFHFDSTGTLLVKVDTPSTGPFAISSIAGVTRTAPTDTNWASSAGFHFDSSGGLQVAVASPSTIIAISTVGGIVAVRPSDTNWGSSAGFHFDSSGALTVKEQAASTGPFAISSIAGQTRTAPASTLWASSAGFHFDSSGALTVAASFSGSTDVQISAVAKSTTAQNSSNYLPVRLSDGSSFLTTQDVTDGSTNSTLVGGLIAFNNSSGNTMRIVGSTSPLPVNVIGGALSGSSLATAYFAVQISNGSTFVTLGTDYSDGSTTSTVVGPAIIFDNSSNHTMRAVSTATPLPVAIIAGTAAGSTDISIHGVTASTFVQNSSAYLAVRITDGSAFTNSTLMAVSSVAGIVAVRPSDTNWASSAGFHFDSSGALTVAASFSGSTDVQISAVAKSTTAQNSTNYLPVRLTDGTAFLTSTTVSVSTVGGIVAVRPSDTNWASSAGFHFNSSGELLTVAAVTTSTTVNVSSLAGAVIVRSSAADHLGTVYQSTYTDLNGLMRLADRDQSTQVAAVLNAAPASTVWALAVRTVGGTASTDVTAKQGLGNSSGADAWPTLTVDSSNAIVKPGDSANNAIRVNVVAGAAAGSTDVSVHGVTVSTFVQNSSAYLAVRLTDGSSFLSGSSIVAVSSLGGVVAVSSVSSLAGIVRVAGSSLVESSLYLSARISDGSTWVTLGTDYSEADTPSTVVGPAIFFDNSSAHTMRPVSITAPLPVRLSLGIQSFNSTTSTVVSTATTAVYTILSSAASTRYAVYAYSITSTASSPMAVEFLSSGAANGGGSTGNMWALDIGSQSSGVTGANLAVSPMAWLFRTNASEPLSLRLGSTNVQVRVSVSYFLTS